MPAGIRTASAIGAASLSGWLFFAAFPPLDRGSLAALAFVPLLLSLRKSSAAQAFWLGWWTGTLGCSLLVTPSIYTAASNYFHASPWSNGGFALLAPQLYAAPYFGLFALAARRVLQANGARWRWWLIPCAWVATELARANSWHGCPWVLLGHAAHHRPGLIQIADFSGVYGVSFVLMTINVALVSLYDRIAGGAARAGWSFAIATVLLLAAVLGYGEWQLRRWGEGTPTLKIALVQPNLPRHQRASPLAAAAALERLSSLTRAAVEPSPALVVWPENALGFVLPANQSLLARVAKDLPAATKLLLGSPRTVEDSSAPFRNSAFLVGSDGAIVQQYDKMRLTPYAETAPLGWLQVARRFVASDIYGAGDRATLFALGDLRFATLICFEAIYPDLVRRFVREGAELLINISNDDWFGDRAAIEQHFVAVLFRAVEYRRFLLRDTNTGLTAIVDPAGRVVAKLARDNAATLAGAVYPVDEITLYARWGDAFAWLCVLAALFSWGGRRSVLGRFDLDPSLAGAAPSAPSQAGRDYPDGSDGALPSNSEATNQRDPPPGTPD